MYWKCFACGTINGGLSKRCGDRVIKNGKVTKNSGEGCGKHQDREEWFSPEDISVNANLTDANDIAKAEAGVDWFCGYCGSTQRGTNGECVVCGGDKKASKEDREGKYHPHLDEHIKHTINEPKDKSKFTKFVVGGLFVVPTLLGLFGLLTPRHVDAKVQSVSWTGTVHVERYSRFPDSGWMLRVMQRKFISMDQDFIITIMFS